MAFIPVLVQMLLVLVFGISVPPVMVGGGRSSRWIECRLPWASWRWRCRCLGAA